MFTNESPPCSRSDRATQWLNLAGTFGGHPDYTYSSSWISISKESLLAASLGNLCQFWITFTVEVFQDSFPMYLKTISSISFCVHCPPFCNWPPARRICFGLLFKHTCIVLANCAEIPLSLFFLGAKAPRTSTLSFYDRWSKTFVIFMALCLLPSCAVHHIHAPPELGNQVVKQDSLISAKQRQRITSFGFLTMHQLIQPKRLFAYFSTGALCLFMNNLNAQNIF